MTGLLIAVAIIAIIVIVVSSVSSKNSNVMMRYLNEAFSQISNNRHVEEISTGEFSSIKIGGVMNFKTRQYYVGELGNVSVMTMNMGIMQMGTMVITPLEKDIPLLSADFIFMFSNRKAIIEMYDVTDNIDEKYTSWIEKYKSIFSEHGSLTIEDVGETWYKNILNAYIHAAGKTGDEKAIGYMFSKTIASYLLQSDSYPILDDEQAEKKKECIEKYSNGLINNGGPSTDVFKKSLGEEKTKEFFEKVFFGTAKQ